MLSVGLTGGIASGKSTVVQMFRGMGARIVDLDALSRVVVEPGKPAWEDIVKHFGEGILKPDRTLNREALGRTVFEDPESRKMLEAFVHPRIFEEQAGILNRIKNEDPHAIVVIDVPLLIEFGLHEKIDAVVLVHIPGQAQLKRLMERDGFSLEEAEARIQSQMPIDQKIPLAHFVIDNSGDPGQTRKQVEAVMRGLKKMEMGERAERVDTE
jgi:dephospho-CoA kinase